MTLNSHLTCPFYTWAFKTLKKLSPIRCVSTWFPIGSQIVTVSNSNNFIIRLYNCLSHVPSKWKYILPPADVGFSFSGPLLDTYSMHLAPTFKSDVDRCLQKNTRVSLHLSSFRISWGRIIGGYYFRICCTDRRH